METQQIVKARLVNHFSEEFKPSCYPRVPTQQSSVTEAIGDSYLEWNPSSPVFIYAPTGTGKTSFMRNVLLKRIADGLDEGQLLYVANRRALSQQAKRDCLKIADPHALTVYSDSGILETNTYENVQFVSYQGLPALMHDEMFSSAGFKYVVFDECHWFTSDALFAENTWKLLSKLPAFFRDSIRIYMSATPWMVRNIIDETEVSTKLPIFTRAQTLLGTRGICTPEKSTPIYYVLQQQYRNYHIHYLPAKTRGSFFIKGIRSLLDTLPRGEKVIIFVDSKKNGKALQATLRDAAYIDTDSKNGTVWSKIVNQCQFDARVLIATAVADCGINIWDDAVRHIVLFSIDHTQFMQELGRKRLSENERIHLYVPDLSKEQVEQQLKRVDNYLSIIYDFQHGDPRKKASIFMRAYYSDDSCLRRIIALLPNREFVINRCAEEALRYQAYFLNSMISNFNSADEGEADSPFLKVVHAWLQDPNGFSSENWWREPPTTITDKNTQLINFLSTFVGQLIEKGKPQEEFSSAFRSLHEKLYGKRSEDNSSRTTWGSNIIKKVLTLRDLPFELEIVDGGYVLHNLSETNPA